MPTPLVSVIMPVFNYEQYVRDSMASVLNSTEKNLELIVVDDGSTDDDLKWIISAAMAEDDRVEGIFHKTNLGISASRNDALKAAKGEYIAFCDADDLWLPEKLEKQLELLTRNPEADIAYGDSKIINDKGEETGALFSARFPVPGSGSGNLFPTLCVRNFINTQTVLLRRSILGAEDLFDVNIQYGEDWLFWTRLARTASFIYTPEVLGFYRVHEGNSTSGESQGVIRNRIKVYLATLHFCEHVPRGVLSQVFYHLGVGLSRLKEEEVEAQVFNHYSARRAFKSAFMCNPFNLKAAARLLLCLCQK